MPQEFMRGAHYGQLKRWQFPVLHAALSLALIMGSVSSSDAAISVADQAADAAPVREIATLKTRGYINAVAWSSDGSRVATLSDYGEHIKLWDATNWEVIHEFDRYPGSYSQNSFGFLPDGSVITSAPIGEYSGNPNDPNTKIMDPNYKSLDIFSLIQWNPVTGKTVRYIPATPFPVQKYTRANANTFAISPDGMLLAGVTGKDETYLYRMSDDVVVTKLVMPEYGPRDDIAYSLAFSPDGKELAMGTLEGWIFFFDSASGNFTHKIEAWPESYDDPFVSPGREKGNPQKVKVNICAALAFSPDGKYIAAGKHPIVGEDPAPTPIGVRVFNVADGSRIAELAVTPWPSGKPNLMTATSVRSLAWSWDGKTLAAGDGRSLRLWNTANKMFTPLFVRPTKVDVYSVAFSKTGLLASTHNDEVEIYKIP